MFQKIPCSVLVLTRNSEATLERCLQNLEAFAEIVIHDANSEDRTVEIAKKFKAIIFKQYETEEKSVRVKNFTDMRLQQRAAASNDWVLYLDSDEYLSDALVQEIGEILAQCNPKTIILLPRVPVIDGIPRVRGMSCSEIMPRIHHRRSGCTFKSGKLVHEKYVYDDSFREIVTKNCLYVPIPSVEELRSKDDRYLLLEVERIRQTGYAWNQYVRWILFREPLVILSLLLKILWNSPNFLRQDSVPFAHEWRYVRYHWCLLWVITGAMMRHPLARGRVIK